MKSQWSLSMSYFTTVSQQMLTAIKHVATDNFVLQQDSALVHKPCISLDGVWIPLAEGAILEVGKHGHAHGRFTKGHGSLGRRCGLLSNYFDLLLKLLCFSDGS